MSRISGRMPAIIVEYDSSKGRAQREFKDGQAHLARRFYSQKFNAGQNPTLKTEEKKNAG